MTASPAEAHRFRKRERKKESPWVLEPSRKNNNAKWGYQWIIHTIHTFSCIQFNNKKDSRWGKIISQASTTTYKGTHIVVYIYIQARTQDFISGGAQSGINEIAYRSPPLLPGDLLLPSKIAWRQPRKYLNTRPVPRISFREGHNPGSTSRPCSNLFSSISTEACNRAPTKK